MSSVFHEQVIIIAKIASLDFRNLRKFSAVLKEAIKLCM